jgi:carboxypeptidase Q
MKRIFSFIILLSFSFSAFCQEFLDQDAVAKIKKEGLQNSQVMNIAFNLTDGSGPRLTNSPGFDRAANWAMKQLSQWGLTNARLDPWGEFGKGWELQKIYIAMTAPYYRPLIGFPKAWTSGTNGLKNADIILIDATDSLQLEQYKGKLKGKAVMMYRNDTMRHSFSADAKRTSDEELEVMANAQPQAPRSPADTAQRRGRMPGSAGAFSVANRLREMAKAEGAVAILSMNPRGRDGTLFVGGGGSYAVSAPDNFTDIMLGSEDYLSLCRLAKAGEKVRLDIDMQARFITNNTKAYNVIAEIKGSDPKLQAEVVMLGGHLDSWHGSVGATDNASGCAVMMEAVRILKATGLQPKRTIRIALWSAEEQGLLGSRGYVKNVFSDSVAHNNFNVYFNMDNGTGKFRGVYLQGNEAARPVFSKWLEPFHEMGAKTLTINNTGSTDHVAFDGVGLPGFQFIQDPIAYSTRTHHTTMDNYDHLVPEDLMHNAVIVASFIYHAANRAEKFPRKTVAQARPF